MKNDIHNGDTTPVTAPVGGLFGIAVTAAGNGTTIVRVRLDGVARVAI